MYIDTNSIITAASILTAMGVLVGILVAVIKFIAHPKEQDEEIGRIKKVHADDMKAINKEQCLITYGLLACLKGVQEKGCNGPVTEAINKIEKHLNQQAHETEE